MTDDASKLDETSGFAFEDALSKRKVLNLFFEESLDLFCVADHSGHLRKVNRQFEEVLGYSAEELTTRPYMEFVHPDDREATAETMARLVDDEEITAFRNRYIARDDSVVWLEWQARPVDDLVYASARDITDLKRAEAERAKLKAQFQKAQKLESVAVLAGGIAHDFNNLLTTIVGNAGLIPMLTPEDSPAAERADAILQAAQAAADLCEQLLAYAGKGQFNVEYRNLNSIVASTDHLLEASIDRCVQLSYDLEDHLPAAELDDTQVRQILMNVVKNASDAIEGSSGHIRIATGHRHCGRDYLSDCYLDDDLQPGRYVYLEIRDDGCGMTRAELKRIFDPFYTTKDDGRGLGLAASLGILRAHNGALRVNTDLEAGTTFRFLFPAVDTNTPFTPTTPIPSAQPLKSTGVLVIDDDSEIRDFVRETLEHHGARVCTASTAYESLTNLQTNGDDVSVVLLDPGLPETDARALYDKLLDIEDSLDIVLSSGGAREEVLAGFPEQDITFLAKPYGPKALLRTLAKTDT